MFCDLHVNETHPFVIAFDVSIFRACVGSMWRLIAVAAVAVISLGVVVVRRRRAQASRPGDEVSLVTNRLAGTTYV